MSKSPELSSAQIEQICRVVADTDRGLRGSEIAHMLAELKIPDGYAAMTKWKRLYNALVEQVNHDGSTVIVFKFLEHCFEPARGLEDVDRYRWMMVGTNRILMLAGVEVRDDGRCHGAQAADTLSEVQRRTRALRNKLYGYGAHPEVLRCCREELLVDDYFHAVFEASKGGFVTGCARCRGCPWTARNSSTRRLAARTPTLHSPIWRQRRPETSRTV